MGCIETAGEMGTRGKYIRVGRIETAGEVGGHSGTCMYQTVVAKSPIWCLNEDVIGW